MKAPDPNHPDRRTAYHEAGHAIVATALGVNVNKITIVANTSTLGECHHEPPLTPTDRIAIATAGSIAEFRATGDKRAAISGCGGDMMTVERALLEAAHNVTAAEQQPAVGVPWYNARGTKFWMDRFGRTWCRPRGRGCWIVKRPGGGRGVLSLAASTP